MKYQFILATMESELKMIGMEIKRSRDMIVNPCTASSSQNPLIVFLKYTKLGSLFAHYSTISLEAWDGTHLSYYISPVFAT